jgi:5,5'-dehydrodivanillate O-demethylase
MISTERNELLTQTSAGTPMGDLLRRYWWPIAGASELPAGKAKPVRLMGEDLALYRDGDGGLGLVQRNCPHRNTDLSLGIVERCGLRCSYHGWMFDRDGNCVEQPYEDAALPDRRMKDNIKVTAYPAREHAGVIFAYLGPVPAPEIPDWEFFNWAHGWKQIVISEIPCNWFQCQENSIDPVHFEWMHDNWGKRLRGDQSPYGPKHLRVGFDEFEHGFVYRRVKEDTDEQNPLWTVGRVCLWPNALYTGEHVEWRVPIDDENTLSVTWQFNRVPKEQEPYVQNEIPTWHGPITNPDGSWINTHVMNQDFIAWVGQGRISDRTKEHLGPSDQGILMIRRRFMEDIERVQGGADPKAVIRDPAAARDIALPVAGREAYTTGRSRHEILSSPFGRTMTAGYFLQAGQPADVRKAFLAAMGLEEQDKSTA